MLTTTAFAKPYLVHTAKLTWCEQNNGQNGESRTLVWAPVNPTLCPVSTLFRIMEQFQALNLDKHKMPLSVFTDTGLANGTTLCI